MTEKFFAIIINKNELVRLPEQRAALPALLSHSQFVARLLPEENQNAQSDLFPSRCLQTSRKDLFWRK